MADRIRISGVNYSSISLPPEGKVYTLTADGADRVTEEVPPETAAACKGNPSLIVETMTEGGKPSDTGSKPSDTGTLPVITGPAVVSSAPAKNDVTDKSGLPDKVMGADGKEMTDALKSGTYNPGPSEIEPQSPTEGHDDAKVEMGSQIGAVKGEDVRKAEDVKTEIPQAASPPKPLDPPKTGEKAIADAAKPAPIPTSTDQVPATPITGDGLKPVAPPVTPPQPGGTPVVQDVYAPGNPTIADENRVGGDPVGNMNPGTEQKMKSQGAH